MNQDTKQKKLQQHKNLALGLLLLMLVLYITAVICQRKAPQWSWVGYLKTFSEAAMVGALADWFAVVALFRRPMGLNIPHTNLIEARKNPNKYALISPRLSLLLLFWIGFLRKTLLPS